MRPVVPSSSSAAIRNVSFGQLDVATERRGDGTVIVRSTAVMDQPSRLLIDRLRYWAQTAPERTFLARRRVDGAWQCLTYAAALEQSNRIASALLSRHLSPERPIVLLSGNDLEHALLALSAMSIGQPYAPISPAYSLISKDFGKLRSILGRLSPQLVFAADGGAYARAIMTCCGPDVEIVTTAGGVEGRKVTEFASLATQQDDPQLEVARQRVKPETIAKVLFTSGSTGEPKGVVTTHGMLTVNQAMIRHWLASVLATPLVLVDWLPWNHVFGGSHNFGMVLENGGTLYIDGGRPVPGGFAETLRNLKEISPSIYFNVPKGYEELVAAMRSDKALRETFFNKLSLTFYSGASLPQHVADELDAHAIATVGERILMVTGFGSTETAPAAIVNTRRNARLGNVGVPLPGVSIKLVRSGDKLEARIKAASVMSEYWGDQQSTAAAFDEEGYYRFGDAFRFAEADDVEAGLIFDGRVSEDFKLATGTWVSVGPLRARLVGALAPFAKDVVIAGHDRGDVTALVFPDLDACRAHLEDAGERRAVALLSDPRLMSAIGQRLREFREQATGSSTDVKRLVLLDEPASIDAGEITDKGSINQQAVLRQRHVLVDELYLGGLQQRVISAE